MEVWNKLERIWNRVKAQDKKIYSTILITLFLCSTLGFVLLVNRYTTFANSEIYTMTNNIYFEATELGKSTSEVIHLAITENTQDFSEKPDPIPEYKQLGYGLIKDSELQNPMFSAKVNKSLSETVDMYGIIDSSLSNLNYEGFVLNMTNTNKAIMANYKTETMLSNLSDYQENFNYNHNLEYQTKAKSVFFAEPLYYCEEWCIENSYLMGDILNSTYTDNTDYIALNSGISQLVSSQVIVTSYTNYYSPEELNRMGLKRMNIWERNQNPLEVKEKCPWCIVIAIIVIAIMVVPQVITGILDSQRIQAYEDMAEKQIWMDGNVTITSINAERDIQIALVNNKGSNINTILSLYGNGSISFEDAQTLIKQVSGSYDESLNVRTMNIKAIGESYYNHTNEMWNQYKNAIGITTNWTDYLTTMIYVFVGLIIFYVIYLIFIKKKGNSGISSNVFFVSPNSSGIK
jgi:hypothetical protein